MDKYVIMLEDDRDDRYLTTEILEELDINIPVQFFAASTDLFQFLSTAAKPSLILVDYNTTPDNGISVLKKLKGDEGTADVPVVILSDSSRPQDMHAAYVSGASSFIKKPDNMEETRKKIETFFRYWLDVAEV